MARRPNDKPVTVLRVVRNGYEPASAYDAEFHARYSLGAEVAAEIVLPKNLDLLKKYWWTLGMVVPNQDTYAEAVDLSTGLLGALGYSREIVAMMGGDVLVIPRGISELDGTEFPRFVDRAFALIEDRFGIDVEALQAEARRATQSKRGRS